MLSMVIKRQHWNISESVSLVIYASDFPLKLLQEKTVNIIENLE